MKTDRLREAAEAVVTEYDKTSLTHDVTYEVLASSIDCLRLVMLGRDPGPWEEYRDRMYPAWTCDWVPDELNPGPECPYCAGDMCARIDNLNCRHDLQERHG